MSFFDIFGKKPDKQQDPAAAALGPQTSTPFPGVAAMGSQVTMSSPSGYSQSQLQHALAGLAVGLTKEEQEQLQNLRTEHTAQVKLAKLGTFKKLPGTIRQQVIDAYEWKICFDNMNATTVVKDPRLAELEKKEEMYNMFTHSGMYKRHTQTSIDPSAYPGIFYGFNQNLPQGLTLEDLKHAHMEASLEEEMLGNGKV